LGDAQLDQIKALLFDLGGVVFDVDFNNMFSAWANYSNRKSEEIKARFALDEFYHAFERGEIDLKEYFSSLRAVLGIDISDFQFEEGWNSVFNSEIPGIRELLLKTKEKLPLFAFTNSNRVHQKIWENKFSNTLSLFHTIFTSSDIGLRKPEPGAYRFVANSIGVEMNQIVFFDDSIENVIGAKQVGMNAVHVKSTEDVKERLLTIRS